MQIFGNVNTANKFFIYLDDGGLEWTSNFTLAKRYVENPQYKNWYGKQLYCTNEDVIKGYDGKLYLRSKCPENPNIIKTYDNKSRFVESAKKHMKEKINEILKENDFESLSDLYTFKDSKVKKLKKLCEDICLYRDNLLLFFEKILKKHSKKLNIKDEIIDISEVYDDFINNLPKFKETSENE